MHRPRILLAEDHPGMAEELRQLLDRDFDVVAVVSDGVALLAAIDEVRPDVVVTDIMMPGFDGITATSRILARRPATRIVLVTIHNDPALAERGYATGALAYVPKIAAPHELVPAVHAALRGERYGSPQGRGAQA
jgi:two-component system NarL family response regulator